MPVLIGMPAGVLPCTGKDEAKFTIGPCVLPRLVLIANATWLASNLKSSPKPTKPIFDASAFTAVKVVPRSTGFNS